MSDPALCIDCERSTGAACPRHPMIPSAHEWHSTIVEAARLAAFEECARICDDMATMVMPSNPLLVTIPSLREHQAMSGVAKHCAHLIRARGKP